MSKEECQFRVKKYSLFTNIGNHSTKGAILKAMPIIVFKYGGKILFAAGFLDSVVDIYHAKDKVRETVLLGFSWAGAAAGAYAAGKFGALAGSFLGPVGTMVGGAAGSVIGGFAGWHTAEYVTKQVYDYSMYPLQKEEYMACVY